MTGLGSHHEHRHYSTKKPFNQTTVLAQLDRNINTGYRPAGSYRSAGRAAYWDGKLGGEKRYPVASIFMLASL